MFRACAYGLTIDSDLALPELATSELEPDIVVRIGRIERRPHANSGNGRYVCATPRDVTIFQPDVGSFMVRDGSTILVDPVPGTGADVLRLFVLGPALAVLLHQRGFCVLHASGVAVRDGAIGFLGGPGYGKSTMAAALYARRHGIVADDVLAVDLSGSEPMTWPAFPQLKLWPDSLGALGESFDSLPLLHPLLSKRARAVTDGFPRSALPLKRLYVLSQGDRATIQSVEPQQSFLEIVRHSYAASLIETTATGASHLHQSSRLVSCGLVHRLTVPRSLSRLNELATLVERDAGASSN